MKAAALEILGWLVVVAGIVFGIVAIAAGMGCDRLKAMQPADPMAAINAAAEAQRVCTEAARICDECEQPPGPTYAEVMLSPCAAMCLDATQECVEVSRALAETLEPGDAGAGGK